MADDTPVELKALVESFTKAQDKVKEIADKALAEAATTKGMAEQTKLEAAEKLTEMNTKASEVAERLGEIEKSIARRDFHGGGQTEMKTLGEFVTENEEIKAL